MPANTNETVINFFLSKFLKKYKTIGVTIKNVIPVSFDNKERKKNIPPKIKSCLLSDE